MFREIILPIFRSTRLCVTVCGIMHRRCCRPQAGNIAGALWHNMQWKNWAEIDSHTETCSGIVCDVILNMLISKRVTYPSWFSQQNTYERCNVSSQVLTCKKEEWISTECHSVKKKVVILYTWCNRRNGPDFGRVFLMLNYTENPQNTYIQSWTDSEIMASEVWNFDSCYTLTDYQIHIETGRNMWFL